MEKGKKSNGLTIALGIALIIVMGVAASLYFIRFDSGFEEGLAQGYEEGFVQGKSEQVEALKADPTKGVIPDFVGGNADAVGYWSAGGPRRFEVSVLGGTIPIILKATDGSAATEGNLQEYKVIAQDPAPYTVFEVVYKTRSDGELSSTLESSGVQLVTLTLEKLSE